MKNRFVIDWVSFTSKIHSPEQIISFLGLEKCSWETIKGARGYRDRLYSSYISIHYNGAEDMGVWCEFSGKGCRAFEDYGHGDYQKLFDLILFENTSMNLTRLDIAYDDFIGIFDMPQLSYDTMHKKYISKFRSYDIHFSNTGNTIIHGSKKSDLLFRIYDKAAEQKVDISWVRFEAQLRDDRALGFVKALRTSKHGLGDLFLSVVSNYLRYVIPSETDTNNRRWPNMPYWDDFICDAQKITIYEKPGVDYDLSDLENFVFKQAGNGIKTYIDIVGEDAFLHQIKNRQWRPNPKYEVLKSLKGILQ